MQRRSWKRATAVLAGLAISGAGLVGLASPAKAAVTNLDVTADGQPTIVRADDQVAGDLVVSFDSAAKDDKITLRVATSDENCANEQEAARAITFSKVTEETDHPSITVGAPQDGCAGGTLNNEVVLTITADIAAPTSVRLNVEYDVVAQSQTPLPDLETGANPGPVRIFANGVDQGPAASNAKIAATDRIAGTDRFATAGAIGGQFDANGCAERVVVVNGRNFPDALAAAYLGYPILLVEQDSIPQATRDALAAMGTREVLIVGGTGVVDSVKVFEELEKIDETAGTGNACDPADGKIDVIRRIAGGNRYETASLVASHTLEGDDAGQGTLDSGLNGCTNPVKTVILASGENFPDALAAGPLAADGTRLGGGCGNGNRIPVILTHPTLQPNTTHGVRAEAETALSTINPEQVVILGGTAAIAQEIQDKLDDDYTVTRIAGGDRFATAQILAERLQDHFGFEDSYLIANGLNFPDALVGGPLGGHIGAAVLLTPANALSPQAIDNIDDTTFEQAYALGGTAAISQAAFNGINSAFLSRN